MTELFKKSLLLATIMVFLKFSNGQYYNYEYYSNNVEDQDSMDNNIVPENPKAPANAKVNYCNYSPVHTMCKYPPGKSSNCRGNDYFTLRKADEGDILQRHNALRNNLSLPPLKWNSTLAEIAQRWADQCDFNHDEYRYLGPNKLEPLYQVGQNLAISFTRGYKRKNFDIDYLTKIWINERANVKPQHIKHLPGDDTLRKIGHYTQMVWGKTREIGCGGSAFDDHRGHNTYLVCNYYPSGNLPGARVY